MQYKNDIAAFFRETHPDATAEFGFSAEVMDTYIKSLAGYSVITYLLAIVSPPDHRRHRPLPDSPSFFRTPPPLPPSQGDRHLDNIMLQADGHLFHLGAWCIALCCEARGSMVNLRALSHFFSPSLTTDFGYIFGRDPKPFPAAVR